MKTWLRINLTGSFGGAVRIKKKETQGRKRLQLFQPWLISMSNRLFARSCLSLCRSPLALKGLVRDPRIHARDVHYIYLTMQHFEMGRRTMDKSIVLVEERPALFASCHATESINADYLWIITSNLECLTKYGSLNKRRRGLQERRRKNGVESRYFQHCLNVRFRGSFCHRASNVCVCFRGSRRHDKRHDNMPNNPKCSIRISPVHNTLSARPGWRRLDNLLLHWLI